ncbi:hypothetical protein L6164_001041 [Bauhinia variegata]|uniref:Uncharacterized protein n=1 Tax=Bauhinia variegata TaxID=167791 RepID=A0ACB9Q8B0_BAUVA|nr:hypothetical protein L6164_001041 [Bauhinia variegata]
MRDVMINLIPRITYAHPNASDAGFKDAVDVALIQLSRLVQENVKNSDKEYKEMVDEMVASGSNGLENWFLSLVYIEKSLTVREKAIPGVPCVAVRIWKAVLAIDIQEVYRLIVISDSNLVNTKYEDVFNHADAKEMEIRCKTAEEHRHGPAASLQIGDPSGDLNCPQVHQEFQHSIQASCILQLREVLNLILATGQSEFWNCRAQAIKLTVGGRGKMGFLTSANVAPDDTESPTFHQWHTENLMVSSWLINAMAPEIKHSFMFIPTAHEIWEVVTDSYSDGEDLGILFELKTTIWQLKQGDREVTNYWLELTALCQELNHLSTEEWSSAHDAVWYKEKN